MTRPIVLIPSYNTGAIVADTVAAALRGPAPVWVVIDGSTDGSEQGLERFTREYPDRFRLIHLAQNSGKGAAVLHGLRLALKEGITHILAMDADGQHPATYIERYLELSARHPEAAIFGRPVFDSSAPAIRVNGRKISNFWTNLETLGWGIDDSLFGMRVYPAQELLEVFESTCFARRFDFDPECAIRLAWKGVPILNIPTPVRYLSKEEGGVSQFRYLRDNILLTWMHSRLVCGFLLRLPWLALRGENPLLSHNPSHS